MRHEQEDIWPSACHILYAFRAEAIYSTGEVDLDELKQQLQAVVIFLRETSRARCGCGRTKVDLSIDDYQLSSLL